MSNAIDNAADFFTATQMRAETVEIPGTGKTVRVRELSAGKRIELLEMAKEGKNAEFNSAVLLACVIRPDGTPMLTADDIKKMAEASGELVEKLVHEVLVLSGLARKKNLAPTDDLPTD